MSATLQKPDPLAPFTRIAPSVYSVEPQTQSKDDNKGLSTILIPFWMNTPPRAAVKYVVKYAELAPFARIIFLFTNSEDFYKSRASHQLRLKPLIDILVACQGDKSKISSESGDDGSVYIHIFSNGGVFATAQLLQAYKAATGRPLRVSSMVIDSAPGKSNPSLAIKAFSYGLPQTMILRQLSYVVLSTVIWGAFLTRKCLGLIWRLFQKRPDKNDDAVIYGDDPLAYTRKTILDPEFSVARSPTEKIKMCYIYSDADELVPWKDVEEHAALASKSTQGGRVVDLEKFRGTPHVGHMMSDPERYWDIVKRYLI